MARPLLCFIFRVTFLSPYFCAAPAPPLLQTHSSSMAHDLFNSKAEFLFSFSFIHFPLLLETEAGQ